ncbi:hypothetical protein EDC56_1114 [Sinobacterium caligoides]|uniref:Uncharacterized protein n=1 Tax=Sinobacterium caligoides TaxID=933926 RepID=A0A3N2E0M3_9GAMM|nr:hypothetical protein [Sinobacterium caligoides]ROS05577.1 hypothetical protein EDC56_1114 [Sinobacterium caligoides]
MTEEEKTKTESNGLAKPLIIIAALFISYIGYRAYQGHVLLPITVIPLILGIAYENWRISSNWKQLARQISISLAVSLLSFLSGVTEHSYNFEDKIREWPYVFSIIFVFLSLYDNEDSIKQELTEGITLLQSLAVIYWISDIGTSQLIWSYQFFAVFVGIVFCIFSFLHAFTYLELTKLSRLFLSIWSAIIMIIFAADNAYQTYHFSSHENYQIFEEALNFLQYFILGTTLIYTAQNIMLLLPYLPGKGFFSRDNFDNIKESNKKFTERYSPQQIKISDSIIAVIFTAGVYYCNYHFKLVPRNTMIWLVFLTFPTIIWLKNKRLTS